jgi:hypothetical protein
MASMHVCEAWGDESQIPVAAVAYGVIKRMEVADRIEALRRIM